MASSRRGTPAGVETVREATASAWGTCGELVQGLWRGRPCLITLPIRRRSRATVRVRLVGTADPPSPPVRRPPVHVHPPGRWKTARALENFFASLPSVVEASVLLRSSLPAGKGMASSTADLVAGLRAAAAAVGMSLLPETIAAIAAGIEPSDGVMYEGCVVFDHEDGRLLAALGPPPPARLLVLDPGGQVDTVAFARRRLPYTEREAGILELAFSLAAEGVRTGRLDLVGRAATLSAWINQRRLPKPELSFLTALARRTGAAGVVTAHSGTVSALLFPPGHPGLGAARKELVRAFPRARLFTLATLSSPKDTSGD